MSQVTKLDVSVTKDYSCGKDELIKLNHSTSPDGEKSKIASNNNNEIRLKRKITLVNGIALVVGIMIGAGIFVSPKGVFENTGRSIPLALIVWTLCGIFSMLGSLCFSELGTTITRSGGEYAYVLEAFGPFVAFLNLWIQLLVIRPTTQAISALTFAMYLISPFNGSCGEVSPLAIRLLAASCLCLLSYINCRSVRWAMNVQDVFTFAKLLALFIIITAGICHMAASDKVVEWLPGNANSEVEIGWKQLAHAFYSGLFAFGGWNYINVVTEELKNPYKNLPRAAIFGILMVTGLYVLANIAYFAVLTPDEILLSPAVATIFTEKVLPSSAKWFIPIVVAISTFGGLNGILFTTARLFYVASQEKQMPLVMGMISISNSTPIPSLIVSCFMSLIMLSTSDVYALINYFSFTLWLFTGIATAGLIKLRYTKPHLKRPIQFPLILPIIFTAMCFILTLFAIWAEPLNVLVASSLMLIGIPVYFVQKKYFHPNIFPSSSSSPSSSNLDNSTNYFATLSNVIQKFFLVTSPQFNVQDDTSLQTHQNDL